MAQTLQNQIINAKSMNGIMQLSDGVATMENGNLTNLTSVDTDTLTTTSFSANDFQVSTNIDLTSATSQIRFTDGVPANNTTIGKSSISTPSLSTASLSLTGALNMNNNNITNGGTITGTTITGTSASLTGALNMNNNNINNVNNINLTTINGSAPGGLQNLSSVLAQGNSAGIYSINMNNNAITNAGAITGTTITGTSASLTGTLNMNNNNITNGGTITGTTITGTSGSFTGQINMNTNNIININELKISKTTTGVGNPALLLQCDNTDANAENIVVNRYSTTPATSDILFAVNVNGRDSLLNSVEYTRISSDILDPLSTAPKGQMRFYTRGGINTMSTYEVLQLQDAEIDALRNLNMNSNNISNVNTITGVSNTISVNSNTISNINQLSINKGTGGTSNPAITIDSTSGDANPANMIINRFSSTPASADELFTININGKDNVGATQEYCRISSQILNVSSSIPQGEIDFFCKNGTTAITDFPALSLTNDLSYFYSGVRYNEQNYNLVGATTIPSKAMGGIFYIRGSTGSNYTLTLPPTTLGNGCFFYIVNNSGQRHTLSSTANIEGQYGSQTTTQLINVGQGYLLTLQNAQWRVNQVFGLAYQQCRYHTLTQTGVGITNVNGLFNTACNNIDLDTLAWSIDSWNGKKLDYNTTTGAFTNNIGYNISIHVQAKIFANPNSTARYAGVLKGATRYQDGTSPNWTQLGSGGTTVMPVSDSFMLRNGESFQIIYQASASSTFGSTTSTAHNRIIITRLA